MVVNPHGTIYPVDKSFDRVFGPLLEEFVLLDEDAHKIY
jgi:hypothetical protein